MVALLNKHESNDPAAIWYMYHRMNNIDYIVSDILKCILNE